MSDIDSLFAEYVAEHRAGGEADPLVFIGRANPDDRSELVELIDGFLARVDRAPFDPDAYRGSVAESTVEALERALGGRSGLWPAVLPRLRLSIGLKRSELVARLSARLDVADQADKVASYYHAMEQGTLDASRVSAQVLDALSGILGESAASLRTMGETLSNPAVDAANEAVFARIAQPDAAMSFSPVSDGGGTARSLGRSG